MAKTITKTIPFREINNVFKSVVEIRADSLTDVTPPDGSWYLGSITLDMSTGKLYGLTSSGEWVEQNAEGD